MITHAERHPQPVEDCDACRVVAVGALLAAERGARIAAEQERDATAAAAVARAAVLEEALRGLVRRLREMEEPLDACIGMSTAHGFPYLGPTWTEQMKGAIAALDGDDGQDAAEAALAKAFLWAMDQEMPPDTTAEEDAADLARRWVAGEGR